MNRFLLSVIGFGALFCGVMAVSCFVLPDHGVCNAMLGAQRMKLERLRTVPGHRIVFVGGSNVGHGFDSSVIEKSLGRPVVNMGLHAGLGLVYNMKSIQDLVRAGDLVVIMPEYEMFSGMCWGKEELVAMVMAVVPEHRRLLTMSHWMRLLPKVVSYACRKLMRPRSLYVPFKKNWNYNEWGDHMAWRSHAERLPIPLPTRVVGEDSYTGEELFPEINAFVSACHENSAQVIFVPPVLEHSSYVNERGLIDRIARELMQNGTPFVAPPEALVFPDDLFFDTGYHMNRKGVPKRMAVLISVLQDRMKNCHDGVKGTADGK